MRNPFRAGRGFRLTKKGDAGISIKVSIPLKQGWVFRWLFTLAVVIFLVSIPLEQDEVFRQMSKYTIKHICGVSIPLKQGSLFLVLPSLWFGAMTWAGFYLSNIASSFTNGNRESYKGGDIVKSAVNFLKKSANRITKSLCIHYDSPVLRSKKLNTFSPILNNQLRYHIKCFITRY